MATAKLGGLMIRTLSKPLANVITRRTKDNPNFKAFCIGVAQTYHRVELGMKMNFLGYKTEPIRPLSEARAIDLGATFMSEFIIFVLAAATVLAETYRASQSTKTKSRELNDEIERLSTATSSQAEQIHVLNTNVVSLQSEIVSLKSLIEQLQPPSLENALSSVSMSLKEERNLVKQEHSPSYATMTRVDTVQETTETAAIPIGNK